jgi:hypothetical protein
MGNDRLISVTVPKSSRNPGTIAYRTLVVRVPGSIRPPAGEALNFHMVPVVGVEPTLLSEHDFESCASANSATPA